MTETSAPARLLWQNATIAAIADLTPRVKGFTFRLPHPFAFTAGQHVDVKLTAPDGYSTNVPVADLVGGKAMVALRYEGEPLDSDHGGPARLLVPHLYFWKSAKWINGLQFTERDEPGFWELRGYHIYGDPWREQRYTGD